MDDTFRRFSFCFRSPAIVVMYFFQPAHSQPKQMYFTQYSLRTRDTYRRSGSHIYPSSIALNSAWHFHKLMVLIIVIANPS
jgi:hypothetical protein